MTDLSSRRSVSFTPVLSLKEAEALQYELPCGVSLEFVDPSNQAVTNAEFAALGMAMETFVSAAGVYGISYIHWISIDDGVFRNDDHCWPALVCSPFVFVEHNQVPGRPVIYIIDESSAILTGSGSPTGLEAIRNALNHGGMASCALALDMDRADWKPFAV